MKSEAIVERIDDFVTSLDHAYYDLPARKFVREFVSSMLVSRSTLLSEICRGVTSSQKSFKALYQKFWRRLSEVDFTQAKEQQQMRALREITDSTVIAIDLGDIVKPHSKTLEGLGLVADGSDDHKIKPGYWLLGAVAVNPAYEEKTPQPLELKIFSASSEGFESENTIVNNFIADVFHKTNGKGIFTIDRGGDRIRIIQPLCELGGKFVIRLNCRHLVDTETNEKIRIKQHVYSRNELKSEVILERRTKNGKRVPMDLRFDFSQVAIPALKKQGISNKMYLVTAWSAKAKQPMELLTTMEVKNTDDAIRVIINYLSRWSVEETYRFIKTDSKLEKMQLRTLGKLENLIAACFLAASITARMARCTSWQQVFEQAVRRQKKAPETLYNWLYRAADAIAVLMKRFMHKIRRLNEPRPSWVRKSAATPGLFPLDEHL